MIRRPLMQMSILFPFCSRCGTVLTGATWVEPRGGEVVILPPHECKPHKPKQAPVRGGKKGR